MGVFRGFRGGSRLRRLYPSRETFPRLENPARGEESGVFGKLPVFSVVSGFSIPGILRLGRNPGEDSAFKSAPEGSLGKVRKRIPGGIRNKGETASGNKAPESQKGNLGQDRGEGIPGAPWDVGEQSGRESREGSKGIPGRKGENPGRPGGRNSGIPRNPGKGKLPKVRERTPEDREAGARERSRGTPGRPRENPGKTGEGRKA